MTVTGRDCGDEITYVKCLEQCLAQSRTSVDSSEYLYGIPLNVPKSNKIHRILPKVQPNKIIY